ncbi:MAG TPA: hypothetical protein VLF95_13225 [Vicinamibacteria bacterium]|nr:hypothetical protein [Vicinamibacteria bacterium]
MRSSTWTIAALALLVPLPALAASGLRVVDDEGWCREDGGNEHARHCEVREATLPASSLLAVDARPNGGIQVLGGDRSDVRLRVKVVATGDSEAEAKAMAGEVQIETTGTVKATGPSRSGGHGWWASYRLEVPRAAHLRLQADNGGLSLEDVAGDAELHTVNGGIHLEGGGGNVHGETVNGGVHLKLGGSEWRGEGLDLRTTNGGLHLVIPEGYNARLETGTVNGGVHSDFPVTTRGRWTGGRIDADLGHGGRLIRVETTNGGLHLQRR